MTQLAFDLRDSFRALRRDRGYSITVALTLALTIGATTAVFSIVNGVLLKPLAYRESHRLVEVREGWREMPRLESVAVNERHFEYWRQHAQSFESMAQYLPLPANLTGVGDATQITVVHASSSLLDVLAVRPMIGRPLSGADERPGHTAVAIITDAFWRQRLGMDRSVLSRSITLDGKPFAVVGVLPPDFRLPFSNRPVTELDAVVPISVDEDHLGWYGDHNMAAIARLREQVTVERARTELNLLQAQVSVRATEEAHEAVTLSAIIRPLTETIVGNARRGLLLLLGAIGAVLLVGCSNLAGLSLTRTTGRLREIAIRSALGAGLRRLVIHALVEQLLLAAVGGVLAVWVASSALRLFVKTAPVDLPRVNEIGLDARVLAFTALMSIAAGILVALLPAWRLAHTDAQVALRSSSGTFTADRSGARIRATLLAMQVALSVTLLVITGLLSASFMRLMHVDKGFTPDRVLAVSVALPANRYADPSARFAAYERLIAATAEVPGVTTVTTMSMLPLTGQGQNQFVVADGDTRPRSSGPSANFRFVSPEFFTTLGVRVIQGRPFSDLDRSRNEATVVISENAAQQLWPGQDPIGRKLSRGFPGEQALEVVGVASDARITSLAATPPLMVYAPYWWRSPGNSRTTTSLLLKTAIDPRSLVSMVRRVVRTIDPDIAIGDARPLSDLVDASMASRRYQTTLFIAFGLVALTIAMIGVYGVTAHGVSRRKREMNIRVALGASSSRVLGMLVHQTAVPVAVGLGVGVLGALTLGSAVSTLLFDVGARDPRILAMVALAVGSVSVATSLAAARQGLVTNPAAALREE